MRKRESLYLHALFALVREELESECDMPAGAFEAYEELDVHPTGVHRSKAVHERAVFALSDRLSTAVASSIDDSAGVQSDVDTTVNQYAESVSQD